MILDSSAVVAVILREPTAGTLLRALARAPRRAIGAPTLVECGIVLSVRLGPEARSVLARWQQELGLEVIAFQDRHHAVALDAFRRFGKGRHPAALDYGDCLAYAMAQVEGEPLLCVGDDFPPTDVALASLPEH